MKVLEELLILVLVVSLPQSCLASVMAKSPLETQLDLTQMPSDAPQMDPIEQKLSQLGGIIITAVQELLDKQESSISNHLKRLELYIDKSCGGTGDGPVLENDETSGLEAAMSTVLNRFTRELSSVAQSFSDNLRQELKLDTQQILKKMEKKTSDFVTKSDLQQFQGQRRPLNQGKTTKDDKNGSEQIKSALVTIDKELTLMNNQMSDFKNYLGNVTPADIMDNSRRILKSLEAFLPLQDSLIDMASRGGDCGLQEDEQTRILDRLESLLHRLTEKVGENEESLSKVEESLQDNGNALTDMLQEGLDRLLQGLTQDVDLMNTGMPAEQESYSARTITERRPTLSDCVDSNFVGSRYDLCATAVRYDKCQLQVVAYHCCRTCVEAGQIQEMGQHRYLHYPRTLNILG